MLLIMNLNESLHIDTALLLAQTTQPGILGVGLFASIYGTLICTGPQIYYSISYQSKTDVVASVALRTAGLLGVMKRCQIS